MIITNFNYLIFRKVLYTTKRDYSRRTLLVTGTKIAQQRRESLPENGGKLK